MRRTLPALLWAVVLSLCLLILPSTALQDTHAIVPRSEAEDDAPKATVFNGQEVPPMVHLNGETYKEQISTGYWFVEGYSPWCHHCQSLAPKLQTIYEFYYTSDPLPASKEAQKSGDSLNTFTRYYDFKFAKLDCVAFGTACQEIGAHSFPTMVIFKDGKEMKALHGDRDIEELSKFIEEALEIARPGSRREGGIELPSVGAKEFHSKEAAAVAGLSSAKDDLIKPPPEPLRPANPDGASFDFSPESFERLQQKTLDPWFIKFYAPWCPHCKQMAPAWVEVAREMKGRLNVGEVNCEVERTLCKEQRIKSYPSIIFFRGPERTEFEGLRGVGSLTNFANQALGSSAVNYVTATDFEELEKTGPVVFIYFYDHATTSEDFMALDRLPLTLMGKAKIVKTDSKDLARRFGVSTWPRLIVYREGWTTAYDALAPHEMRNVTEIRTWMKTQWLPLVPEVTAYTANQLMENKLLVLGILSRDRKEEFAVAKRELLSAAGEWASREQKALEGERSRLRDAKQLRVEEAEEGGDKSAMEKARLIQINADKIAKRKVAFAWLDDVFWERWTKTTFGIAVKKDGEKVVIYDAENHRYWDSTSAKTPIVPSRTSILETLTQIHADPHKLPSHDTDTRFIHSIRNISGFVRSHPIITAFGAMVGLGFWLTTILKVRMRPRRPFGGYLHVEDKAGSGNFMNGKVD